MVLLAIELWYWLFPQFFLMNPAVLLLSDILHRFRRFYYSLFCFTVQPSCFSHLETMASELRRHQLHGLKYISALTSLISTGFSLNRCKSSCIPAAILFSNSLLFIKLPVIHYTIFLYSHNKRLVGFVPGIKTTWPFAI